MLLLTLGLTATIGSTTTTLPSGNCAALLSADALAAVQTTIKSNSVVLLGLDNYRCTMAAEQTLRAKNVCYHRVTFASTLDPVLAYMRCVHEAQIGEIGEPGKQMWHSYLYVDGAYVGDGFMAASLTSFGAAALTCKADCSSILPEKKRQELSAVIAASPVTLYGWSGCPCTSIARNRFKALGVCYMENVWADWDDAKMKYLQCLYGEENHSFVFFKGKFIGNGFKFDEKLMSAATLEGLLQAVGASRHCIKKGDLGLGGRPIKSCTQSNDGTTTGWTRSGSCNWDPSDGGYHEVCVTMSHEFLQSSAKNDANDLSSVVQPGGHWCICAWAFASAVERDPKNLQGIELDCERTNAKLRHVYQHFIDEGKKLTSPSGASYEASTALAHVDRLCGGATAAAAAAAGTAGGGEGGGREGEPQQLETAAAAEEARWRWEWGGAVGGAEHTDAHAHVALSSEL